MFNIKLNSPSPKRLTDNLLFIMASIVSSMLRILGGG